MIRRSAEVVRARGWTVANVDATIVLERPKIGPHVQAMREHLASALGITIDQVSIKAKTNEGVDAVGRGDAIAAHARLARIESTYVVSFGRCAITTTSTLATP